MGSSNSDNSTPNNDLAYHTTTLVTTLSSSAAPGSDPTGAPQSVLTISWFTEIALPSPTPSGISSGIPSE